MKTYIISCIAIFLLCNCAAFKIKPRLAKGMPSFRGQFPFFAFLDIEHEDGGSEICGASLISDRWILTSARCLEDAQEIIVHLGYLNLEEEQEDDRLQFIVHPRNWLKNPNYLPDGMVNDIGLIKLPEAVVFNNFVQPIELSSAISPNVEVIAIGNGATKEGELGTSETIESIDLSITTMSECSETFPFLRHGGSSFCAKDISGERKSIRQGDLGMFDCNFVASQFY